jgi:hypothetical protein
MRLSFKKGAHAALSSEAHGNSEHVGYRDGASGIQVQPDGTRALVACPRDHYVAVVDLCQLTMVAKIDAGREPDGLAWWTR